jgi:hypothetical protein
MHILAAREAVERFGLELPLGPSGDRLKRLAEATRQMLDQALQAPSDTAWADHDLAVLMSEAFSYSEPGLRAAASSLYLGVRRRLLEALTTDPDDLALALALALGTAHTLSDRDDPRLADDLSAITTAVAHPHAGPRLAAAATQAVLRAHHAGAEALQKAALDLVSPLRAAIDRLDRRLPHHPELALDRVRLVLLAARHADGSARIEALGSARGLLADHEGKFGSSTLLREVKSQFVQAHARDSAPSDLARDVLDLLDLDRRERTLDPRRTLKLARTLQRAHALNADVARKLQKLIGPSEQAEGPWAEVKALLFEALGDESSLLSLAEKTLERDPKDGHAAQTLFERLLKNLRQNLASPYPSTTLDLVLQSVPYVALGRLSADDMDAILALARDVFGVSRALTFAREKLTVARELKSRETVWRKALALAEEAQDDEARLDLSRRALREASKPPVEARLVLARTLIARGEDLDEADDALRPLTTERGAHASEAQQLKAKLKSDPRYREARLRALMAFEDQLGVGSPRQHRLKIVFTAPNYVLAELTEKPAPDFYDHKHLRVMIRAEDLPSGVKPSDLKKGDELEAPVRGQDANPEKDREGLRIYWIADQRRVKLAVDPAAVKARIEEEDRAFGIGSNTPRPLRIAWDPRRKRLSARLFDEEGHEFRTRLKIDVENLPEGMEPPQVGTRGKRFTATVERVGEDEYRVTGRAVLSPPKARGTQDALETQESETAEDADTNAGGEA